MIDIISKIKPLHEQCNDYIAFKRASGIKANKEAQVLRRFVLFAEQWEPGATTVSKETAERWATMSPKNLQQIRCVGKVQCSVLPIISYLTV